jgi:hypothetical protein
MTGTWCQMGTNIRMAGRAVLAAAGLACLGVAGPATASSRTEVTAARQPAGRQAVPGFSSGIVPPARAGLGGISCPEASFCVAVGSFADPLGHLHSLAEEWNGRTWRVMPGVKGSGLGDVSCTSIRFCMALGSPIQRWDGRTWTAVRTPPHLAAMSGISCMRASFCMAVGSNGKGTACMTGAVWRGTAWRSMTIPFVCIGNEGLGRVSCASASDCIAVGAQDADEHLFQNLAFGWNGKKWQELDVPPGGPDSGLSGVSCPATSFCMAVGDQEDTFNLAVAWDGTTWRSLNPPPGPDGSALTGVSCTSADRCVAVGGDQAMTWNGTTWTDLTITQPGGSSLGSVSCWRPTTCMAAGSYSTIAGAQLTLAEQWHGSTWQAVPTPSPGDEQEGLSGISCPSTADCMAVGTFINSSDTQATLAEQWNGRAWQVLATQDPGTDENALTAVSCPAARHCMAVGYYDAAGDHQALAEQWNGSTWTKLTVPHNGMLTGVSCPAAGDCVAVGTYIQGGAPQALTVTWDGSTWTVQASPSPGGSPTEFNAISCPSPARCIAVGDYNFGEGQLPLTALWNGTAWTTLTTSAPGGLAGSDNSLTSVSCSRPSNCMAVGRTFHLPGLPFHAQALAESWNGNHWTVRPTPRLKIKLKVHLDAVSCAAPARCRATGGYLTSSGSGFVLAEAWNGATWRRLQLIHDPSPAFNNLYAISCPAPRHCIAVGGTEIQRTLAYLWNGTRWRPLHTPSP